MTGTLIFRKGQGQIYICRSKGLIRLSVLINCMFLESVTYILFRNLHDLDPELQKEARSNVNMPTERPHKIVCFGKSNVYTICHSLRDIHSRNVLDHDPELQKGTRSNENMPIEKPHATFFVGNIISHHLRDIHSQNVHDLDLDHQNGPRSKCKYVSRSPHATSCVSNSNV